MPDFGPQPKQFSQATSTRPGQAISSQLATGTDLGKVSPDYDAPGAEILLGQGVFGNPSNVSLVSGDSVFPDFTGDFEVYDRVESFNTGQSIDISWSGRLSEKQERIRKVRFNLVGDDAGNPTTPPTFVVKIYVEGAATANPVYESTVTSSPSTTTEFVILDSQIFTQPINQKRYHVVLECFLDSGQKIDCSRPFVTQE